MSEFPELHEAYRRPDAAETDDALRRVSADALVPRVGAPWGPRVAALVTGLLIAYAAGYLSASRTSRPATPLPVPAAAVTEGEFVIRPPALVAGPRS